MLESGLENSRSSNPRVDVRVHEISAPGIGFGVGIALVLYAGVRVGHYSVGVGPTLDQN